MDSPREIYEMIGSAPMIRPKLIEIARWISESYCCPFANSDDLRLATGGPAGVRCAAQA